MAYGRYDLVKELVLHLLTYNNTLIVWPRKGVCTESVDIQQDTDLRSRWCRLTFNKTLIYDHDGAGWHTTRHWSTITMVQASRHVVSELTGCYSWLTGCRHQVSPAQNAISGLKMSTVITVDWPREWTCSIPVDLQQCSDLWSWLLWTSKMIPWSILYCIELVHVKWQIVLHLVT